MKNIFTKILLSVIFVAFIVFSVNATSIEISYGRDSCANCQMTILEKKFGTEIITSAGKIFRFDSIECMMDYYVSSNNKEEFKVFLVTDYSNSSNLIDGVKATYFHSKKIPSPMGGNLSAYQSIKGLEKVRKNYPGKIMNWNELIKMVEESIKK